ncbi:MAG: hypothetical protein U0930_24355, partial [Pirellulales bacterium]
MPTSNYFRQQPDLHPPSQLFSLLVALDWQQGQLELPSHWQPVASQSQLGLVQFKQQSHGLLAAVVVDATDESHTQGPPLSQLQLSSSQAQDALLQFTQQSQQVFVEPFAKFEPTP